MADTPTDTAGRTSAKVAELAAPVLPVGRSRTRSAAPKAEPEAIQAEPAATLQDIAAPDPAEQPRASIQELNEQIMATTPNFEAHQAADSIGAAFSDMQDRAKAAYDKGTAAVGDLTEFTKGNVEAAVESGKILAGGLQQLGKSAADEAKSAYELATADLNELAAVKSPTDLFQLQGRIARRNFDALMAAGSRNSEAVMKLASEAFAPLSGRINLAVEKISKAA